MKTKRYFSSPFPYLLALLITALYFAIPYIAQWISTHPTYNKYAGKQAANIAHYMQDGFFYPFGKWLNGTTQSILIFPYCIFILLLIRAFFIHTKKFWKYFILTGMTVLLFLYCFPNVLLFGESPKESIVKGTVSNGKIEYSKRVPFRGSNYSTYSFLCYLAERTFVHDSVRKTIVESYSKCETTVPNRTFILGETGSRHGGQFLPHRTHRNGMSVDFMTPLLKKGKKYRTNHVSNIWGYGLEFDDKGNRKKLSIDYEAMAQHLLALEQVAKENGLAIQKVIFDPVLRPYLLKTKIGQKIKHLPFTKNRVIVRHDDHYHVDFKLR